MTDPAPEVYEMYVPDHGHINIDLNKVMALYAIANELNAIREVVKK